MNYAKLDGALQELLAESEIEERPLDTVLVSIVVDADATEGDRERLEALLDDGLSFDGTIAVSEVTSNKLADISDNPAVLALQLSRRLSPKVSRRRAV
ncbi:MAG TPA: hypothetical protein VGJ81_09900 [Thermoanaerobaculia bacterium]|jgi:hypothetical protein